MTLLETAIELYKGVLAAKPKTDPMFLSLQTFISNNFGHEGFRAMSAVDESGIVFTYKQTGQSRQMRAFTHPLNVAKLETVNVQSNPIPTELLMTGNKPVKQQPAKVTKFRSPKVVS